MPGAVSASTDCKVVSPINPAETELSKIPEGLVKPITSLLAGHRHKVTAVKNLPVAGNVDISLGDKAALRVGFISEGELVAFYLDRESADEPFAIVHTLNYNSKTGTWKGTAGNYVPGRTHVVPSY